MRRFRLMSIATLVVLGVLALVAISPIGHGIAIIGAISVIGLPISLLVVALPSLFLILVVVHLATGSWSSFRTGQMLQALAFTVGLVAMADFFVVRAWRVNWWLDDRVAQMVAGDKGGVGAAGQIGTLAVLRNTPNASDRDNPCDDLCRRLLLTGAVRQVLALTAAPEPEARDKKGKKKSARASARTRAWPALEAAAGMTGTAWRLEQREKCDDPGPLTTVRLVTLSEPPRPRGAAYSPAVRSEELMLLRIAGGTCLVGQDMALDDADALLAYGTLNSGISAYRAGYDAWADTLTAWRVSFWRKDGGVLTEKLRRTGVAWERFPGVLVPTIMPGAELRTANGWLRSTTARNRKFHDREPPIGTIVTEELGLALRLGADGSAGAGSASVDQASLRGEQAEAVDRILNADGPPSAVEFELIGDYIESVSSPFTRRVNGANAEDAERIVRIVGERRIPLTSRAAGAVAFAVQTVPSSADSLAAHLVGRLEALGEPPVESPARSRWDEQIRAITSSLVELPSAALVPHRPEVVALMRDRERRVHAVRFLGHLDRFGPSIAPEVFAMMDDAAALREERSRELSHIQRTWAQVWGAGAQSICRMAPQLIGSVEDFRARVNAQAAQKARPAESAVVAALRRMGVPEDDIRATLAIDPDDAAAMRRLTSALRRAGRDGPCR